MLGNPPPQITVDEADSISLRSLKTSSRVNGKFEEKRKSYEDALEDVVRVRMRVKTGVFHRRLQELEKIIVAGVYTRRTTRRSNENILKHFLVRQPAFPYNGLVLFVLMNNIVTTGY